MRDNPLTESSTPTQATPYSKDPWEIVQCKETGMVFLANPPDYSSLVEEFAWEKTYAEEKASRKKREPIVSFLSSCVKRVRRTLRPKEKIVALSTRTLHQLTKELLVPRPLLLADIGCGTADKAVAIAQEAMAAHGITITPVGIEISSVQADEASAALTPFGGYCIQASAIEGLQQVDADSIDLAILCSFLEHEVNPLPLLRECTRALRPGGRVIIKVPNYDSLNRKIRQRRWCGFRYPDHVNYFTPQTLTQMITKAGLSISRMHFFDRMPTSDNMWVVAEKPTDGGSAT